MKQKNIFYFAVSFLLSAFCFLPHSSAFAQNSFPTDNALWCIKYTYSNMFEHKPNQKFCYGLIGKDTINVNDTLYTYSKLYLLSDTVLSEENSISYIGGFRSEGEKVWFKPYGMLSDILLYDFGASIGDTVWHNGVALYVGAGNYDFGISSGDSYSIISCVDTINGRKRVTALDYRGVAYGWLEGIGNYPAYDSYGGFFGHILAIPNGDGYKPVLECSKHNNVIVYPNLIHPNYPCSTCPCNGTVSVKSYDTENASYLFQNQPNPFSKSTEIKYFIAENANQVALLVFDVRGVLINQLPVYEKGESKTIIHANELQAGTYIYQLVIDGKEIDSKKMILTK